MPGNVEFHKFGKQCMAFWKAHDHTGCETDNRALAVVYEHEVNFDSGRFKNFSIVELPFVWIVPWIGLHRSAVCINLAAETGDAWSFHMDGENMVFGFANPVSAMMLRLSF